MSESDDDRSAYARALRFVRERRVVRPGERVLVASGGGVSSLGVLGFLHLAREPLGLADLAVAAIDHGDDDSADAAADVGRFARLLGVTFHAVSSDGRSVPHVVADLAREADYDRFALGHTRDDAVARVLEQLASGAGLAGLRPWVARRRDGIVRPLLATRVHEALELARTAGIEPVQLPPDESVRESASTRLRREVLPRLRVVMPGVDRALADFGDEVLAWRTALARDARSHVTRGAGPGRDAIAVTAGAHPLALADAIAREALARSGLTGDTLAAARHGLARLLTVRPEETSSGGNVLGPGVVATCDLLRKVVLVRIVRAPRSSEEVVG